MHPSCSAVSPEKEHVVPASLRANISLRSTNGCLQLEPNWTVSFSHPIIQKSFSCLSDSESYMLEVHRPWKQLRSGFLAGQLWKVTLTEFPWQFRASEISEVLVPPLQPGLNLDWISCFMTFNSGFSKSLFWDSFKVYLLHMTLLDHSWILISLFLQRLSLWANQDKEYFLSESLVASFCLVHG